MKRSRDSNLIDQREGVEEQVIKKPKLNNSLVNIELIKVIGTK